MGVFAERLKEMMDRRGMRQADLSAKTGLSKSVISSYVSGRFEPRDERLNLLASVLNCDPLWLAGYDGEVEDQDKDFVLMYKDLSAEDKRTVIRIVQYLVGASKTPPTDI